MPKLGAARLILHDPLPGARNMAVDQALLESIESIGRGTLRFYQWDRPTLSLGYFQRHSDRESHATSRECPVVRRTTGGGAIVHDLELTYSLCLPRENRFSSNHQELYDRVHRSLIASLAECGISGAKLYTSPESRTDDRHPFLCFQRRSPGDVLLSGEKICGSAQRRVAGAILQHGSLLLQKSNAAPELSGVAEITGRQIPWQDIRNIWIGQLQTELNLPLATEELTTAELDAADRIQRRRFENNAWTERR